MRRRTFLKSGLLVGSLGLCSTELEAREKAGETVYIANNDTSPTEDLMCYPDTGDGKHQLHQLWIRKGNRLLTSYRAQQGHKYPYFFPVAGPVSGLSLTSESAMPWPHQRSLFFAMDRVNGVNFWYMPNSFGHIESQGPSFAKNEDGEYKINPRSAEMIDHCFWKQPDQKTIMADKRRFILKILDDRRYCIDAEFVLKAIVQITVNQTNHGLFVIRTSPDLAPDGGGHMVNADGEIGQKNTHGKPSRWLAFYGKRAEMPGVVEGIALLRPTKATRPEFNNCPWYTRDYGNCSPMPMNFFPKDRPMVLSEGEEIKLRYRVVAFTGRPEEAGLDALWDEFDGEKA